MPRRIAWNLGTYYSASGKRHVPIRIVQNLGTYYRAVCVSANKCILEVDPAGEKGRYSTRRG